jgi:hypothetical protein
MTFCEDSSLYGSRQDVDGQTAAHQSSQLTTSMYTIKIRTVIRPAPVTVTIYHWTLRNSGPGSVVGIATAYGLYGPGIESRWGRDFPHLSRPALRPTQRPAQWIPGLPRG